MIFQLWPASIAKDLTREEIEVVKRGGVWPIVVNDVFIQHYKNPHRIEFYVGSGNSGKSQWVALKTLLRTLEPEYSRIIYSRKFAKQIRNSQFQSYKDNIARYGLDKFFRVMDGRMDIIANETGNVLWPMGLDDSEKTKSIADPTWIWIEELLGKEGSPNVTFEDFRMIDGRLRHPEIEGKIIMTTNPISKATWAYKNLVKQSEYDVSLIRTTWRDNHYCPPNHAANMEILRKVAPKEWLIYSEGEWGDIDSENKVFRDESLIDIFTNSFVQPTGQRFITADIAHTNDKFIILVWDGWRVVKAYEYRGIEPDVVIQKIKDAAHLYLVPIRNIAYDASGIGSYVRGWLKNAVAFFGGGAPLEEKAPKAHKDFQVIVKRPAYENLRAQCFFYLAEKIESCEVYWEPRDPDTHVEIMEDLSAIKTVNLQDSTKVKLIPKDDIKRILGRSPDYGDALSMRSIFELVPAQKKGTGRKIS